MTPASREFPLPPLQRTAWLFLVLPALAVAVGVLAMPRAQATPVPAIAGPLMIALVMVGPLLALRRRRIVLDGRVLTVAATFYTRRVAVDELDLAQARIVDLGEHTELSPLLGLNRFGLPGLRAGHYLLRNRRRAFCLLTRRDRVLALPQRDGRMLLLSPERPRDLLDRLRELATPPPRR